MQGRRGLKLFLMACLVAGLVFFPHLTVAQNPSQATSQDSQDNSSRSADCLKIIVGGGASRMEIVARVISQELSRNGVCNSLRFVPSKRATKEFLERDADGEIARVSFYKDVVKDRAVMVPTPLFGFSGVLITRNKKITSIREISSGLGVVRGWLWMKQVLRDNPGVLVSEVDDVDVLVKMFEEGRVEAMLLPDVYHKIDPLLGKYHHLKVIDVTVHMWLRAHHRNRVEQVDQIIANYLNSGGKYVDYLLN